ncbi:MAG: hypothetical protein QOH64_391 [Acidimicrobiaceae bacterium]|jgi:uncharacterized RDD family membrane protein YckC
MTNLPPPPPGPGAAGYQQQGYGYSYGAAPAQPAGFWARFAAALLDGLILGVPLNIVVFSVPDAASGVQLIGFLVGIAYYALLEGGATGQTIGKRALGLRVVDQDTWQPGIGTGRGVGRYFARMLSAIPLGLGYFWMLWDKDKQTWHDKLARTRVVKTSS